MTTLLGYVPTSPSSRDNKLLGKLTAEETNEIARLTEDALILLAPLAQATSRESLDVLLLHTAPRYEHFLTELGRRIWPALRSDPDFQSILEGMYGDLRTAAEVKKDLFGHDPFQMYIGALQSLEALVSWFIRSEREFDDLRPGLA